MGSMRCIARARSAHRLGVTTALAAWGCPAGVIAKGVTMRKRPGDHRNLATQILQRIEPVTRELRREMPQRSRCEGTLHAGTQGMRPFASFLIGSISVIGCATTPPPEPKGGPRGLRASEHLDAARQHDAIARERQAWPEPHAMVPGDPQQPVVMPWFRSWDTSAEHERLAETHRAKAA